MVTSEGVLSNFLNFPTLEMDNDKVLNVHFQVWSEFPLAFF